MYRFSITVLLVWMAALCLAHTTARNEVARANVDRELYKTIHGLWGGSIHYDCANPNSMVSAQVNLTDLSDIELTFGTGFPSGYCTSHGEVTHMSPDSLSILFSCDYGRPCFCSPGSPPVEICMTYSNPTAMSLTLAFVLSPSSEYATCPPNSDFGCMANNTNVGVLELECTSGSCEVCTSSTCNYKGKCNDEGTCTCFESYTGPTCNTSACGPNACNGHGICDISHTRTHYGVAIQDKSTEGRCKCFIGYYGPDCSSQEKFTKFKMTMWQALAFVCVVTSVSVLVIIIRKIKKASFRYRRFIRRRQREERRRSEVELETFVNPVL